MWAQGNVLFAALHIVGSNNNLDRNAENDREYAVYRTRLFGHNFVQAAIA
jgi:hypothetical protein